MPITIEQAQAALDTVRQKRAASPKWTAEDEEKQLRTELGKIGIGGLTAALLAARTIVV